MWLHNDTFGLFTLVPNVQFVQLCLAALYFAQVIKSLTFILVLLFRLLWRLDPCCHVVCSWCAQVMQQMVPCKFLRIMKSTHKLLFALCPMLVLVFIYYSSGKLHLHLWGHKSPFDNQGFLLTLDAKLPVELVHQYGDLINGSCRPGYAAAKMTAIFPKFVKPAPMFLDRNFKRLAKVNNYLPPFGLKTQERIIDTILTATKTYGLSPELDRLSCKRCVIVGNGGILANKSLGSRIDEYDIVVRLNEAPVSGYTRDVGTKTTMRITYPEGAFQKPERYEKDSLFVFSAFKPLDFKWLRHMIFREKLQVTEGFWKSVAQFVPREPSEMRILNPYFIQEAAFQFIGLPLNNGLMGKGNIPTLGTVAITMALHNCDEVAVAGFGYDMNTPHAPLHYYETVKMSAIKESWTHNISKEKEFLQKLVKANVITDLTKGI
ncbi:ST3 beta-galactoside alpha-2,3-sialyltransferase 3b isoform X4 [Hemibagrus wyckioides]|uniref:ST3 beta-galactoside alpha-2,3-sialyltransferase 3b isoform X4 n=1 Tax=Hemibagrus wyckioides TaxID=337641 RepID=UPI00266D4DF6|nr:ST3 beta-galactoside alpha-2,3-sialyltransferase 3b isoform X4 [Hemibagrus wyckioides]